MNDLRRLIFLLLFLINIVSPYAVAEVSNPVVSIPDAFAHEKASRERTAEDDEQEAPSAFSVIRSVRMRRADNLFAAGHYEEALADYLPALAELSADDTVTRAFKETNCAIAYEKLGKYEEALSYYAKVDFQDTPKRHALLLLKLKRYAEAKILCDKQLPPRLKSEKTYGRYDIDTAHWFRFRAVAHSNLGDNNTAVADLVEAAKRYMASSTWNPRDGTNEAQICIDEANALIAYHKLPHPILGNGSAASEEPLTVTVADLPSVGNEPVLDLLRFLVSSKDPFNLHKLNVITGAHMKIPGPTWPDIDSADAGLRAGFREIEYRAQDDEGEGQRFYVDLSKDEVSLDKDSVLKLIPAGSEKKPAIDWFHGELMEDAEAWQLGKTKLTLEFENSGAKLLRAIEISRNGKADPTIDFWQAGHKFSRAKNFQAAVESFGRAIKQKSSPGNHLARAKAYVALNDFESALADATSAVSIGGRPFLGEKAEIESKAGLLEKSIPNWQMYIGSHDGPEVSPYLIKLGEDLLKAHKYDQALEAANKAMCAEDYVSRALFLKARAEAGLHNYTDALRDGKLASAKFFEEARIFLRDEVNNWLKTVGARQ